MKLAHLFRTEYLAFSPTAQQVANLSHFPTDRDRFLREEECVLSPFAWGDICCTGCLTLDKTTRVAYSYYALPPDKCVNKR